jgi:hypothetical protein
VGFRRGATWIPLKDAASSATTDFPFSIKGRIEVAGAEGQRRRAGRRENPIERISRPDGARGGGGGGEESGGAGRGIRR